MPKKSSFTSLYEYHHIFLNLQEDSILPLSKISHLESLFKLNHSQKYEIFYFNKSNINKILNDSKQMIYIKSNKFTKDLFNLFYIILLVKDKTNISNLSNYIYNFKFIEDINEILHNNVSEMKKFILSIIVIELIDNYRTLKDFYDDKFSKKLEEIYNVNIKFISNFFKNNLILELGLDKKDITLDNLDIENIYIRIIKLLIEKERLKDYEFSDNILNELDLQYINLTKKIYFSISSLLDSDQEFDYINKYKIKKIDDLFDENKINFYYLLFKYIYKNKIYIYNSPFLFETKKLILNIIKFNGDKLSSFSLPNKQLQKRMNFVIEFFCDSKYYYRDYMTKINGRLKDLLLYYKKNDFHTKNNDIILIEKFLNDFNDEFDYGKYLKDFDKIKKIKDREPIMNYLFGKQKHYLNDNFEMFEKIERIIKDKKLKKLRKNIKSKLDKYFLSKDNKDILLKIFTDEDYEYYIKNIDDNKNLI